MILAVPSDKKARIQHRTTRQATKKSECKFLDIKFTVRNFRLQIRRYRRIYKRTRKISQTINTNYYKISMLIV